MNNLRLSIIITCSWMGILLAGSVPAHAQSSGNATEVASVPIDTERSVIRWKGTEMWGAGSHQGTVSLDNGYLLLRNNQIAGGKFIADMSTVAVTDIPKSDPIPRNNLREHLKSEDFFHVEKYPTATFEITHVELRNGDSIDIRGNLTIRDITKTVAFTATRKPGLAFYAKLKIDRFNWNVSYLDNSLVDAEITLAVELISSPIP